MFVFSWKHIPPRILGVSLILLLMVATETGAHNVTIFAWAEGDTIYTEIWKRCWIKNWRRF